MKSDILRPEVKGIAVAIGCEMNESGASEWYAYLINKNDSVIKNILVSSKGYGNIQEEKRQTSTLRQFFDELNPKDFLKIEPVSEEVFALSNEYWVSFYMNNMLYDKKFIFLQETIIEPNLIEIPILNIKGVLIE